MITFDDFKKLELKVGKIFAAESVEGSEKLVKLAVDLGERDELGHQKFRQILAGIAKHYSPADLVGRQIVVVSNLEPRMMMGMESQGMLLAADSDGLILVAPDKEAVPGSAVG
ncbi:methionine--tRNA ligase subunit beta [bacterium]|nr:MAG: methionine--tRNA ligase subunit beta [bacterium]